MLDLLKAEYDLARGQNDVALAGFRLLVADIGVGARAHQGAGIASIRIIRINDALGHLSAATKADGSLWRAWSALGVAHDLKRNWQAAEARSEEHTSELQSLMRISYAVFCLKKKQTKRQENNK